eukprot:9738636-Alexandrium_andersonii.AAC.1
MPHNTVQSLMPTQAESGVPVSKSATCGVPAIAVAENAIPARRSLQLALPPIPKTWSPAALRPE